MATDRVAVLGLRRSFGFRCRLGLFACCLLVESATGQQDLEPAAAKVDFRRDVQPLLARHCLDCHAGDQAESGFRLDQRDAALHSGQKHAPNLIVGAPDDSPLLQAIRGVDPSWRMPPDGEPLSAAEVDVVRRWIQEGLVWDERIADGPDGTRDPGPADDKWWAWQPLARSPVPPLPADGRNEVDAFLRVALDQHGISPAPPADPRTLIRRVYFDLIGLPPTPEEVAAFVAAPQPAAYDQLVDRLLASPRYGERWARIWMDAVHFAETHGHDQDRIRENAWPYRDYLIDSFNADKSYQRFVQEQVAGDALFPDDPQATVALGFLAAGPWDESSLRDIREDTLDRQIARYVDRDDMLANVMNNFASVTVQCARCHDHKFDPIPQADYYALQAVFSGVERANRVFDSDPQIFQIRRALRAALQHWQQQTPEVDQELRSDAIQLQVTAWEQHQARDAAQWKILTPTTFRAENGSELQLRDDSSLASGGLRPDRDTYVVALPIPAGSVAALRVELLTDPTLPQRGPGRQDNGNLHLSEIEIYRGEPGSRRLSIARATADFEQEGWGVAAAFDDNPLTAWGIFPRVGEPHQALFELSQRQELATRETWSVVLKQVHGEGHLLGRFRLAIASEAVSSHQVLPVAIREILGVEAAARTADQRRDLARHVVAAEISQELATLPAPGYVYAAASDFAPDGGLKPPPGPRIVQILRRGDIRQPLAVAQPGSLRCVATLPARFELNDPGQEAERRAALAKWLTHPENPLVWRSIVNRVWQRHFGRGLVASLNDFGHMGELPSHPQLLDWLAIWFRDQGQSFKQLHRLLVTSAAYRQASDVPPSPAAAQADPANHWLWRMEPTRLDAECIRDSLLVLADCLDLRMGGPSDRQFDLQPGSHVTPLVDYQKFPVAESATTRRSVYRFLFRTLPDPFMEALDCPAGDLLTPTRDNSVTVQQALALWNDAWSVEMSERFAQRLQREAPTVAAQVQRGVQLALLRSPSADEAAELTTYAQKYGLANFCRVLLNLNEFVYVD